MGGLRAWLAKPRKGDAVGHVGRVDAVEHFRVLMAVAGVAGADVRRLADEIGVVATKQALPVRRSGRAVASSLSTQPSGSSRSTPASSSGTGHVREWMPPRLVFSGARPGSPRPSTEVSMLAENQVNANRVGGGAFGWTPSQAPARQLPAGCVPATRGGVVGARLLPCAPTAHLAECLESRCDAASRGPMASPTPTPGLPPPAARARVSPDPPPAAAASRPRRAVPHAACTASGGAAPSPAVLRSRLGPGPPSRLTNNGDPLLRSTSSPAPAQAAPRPRVHSSSPGPPKSTTRQRQCPSSSLLTAADDNGRTVPEPLPRRPAAASSTRAAAFPCGSPSAAPLRRAAHVS